MKIINFSIIYLFFTALTFAQDCSNVSLNAVKTNLCLPIAEFELQGIAPSGSSATWSTSPQTGTNLYIDENNEFIVYVKVNMAGTYQITMNVSLPNGMTCAKTFEAEIPETSVIRTNVKDEYKLCNKVTDVTFEVLNPEDFQANRWIVDDQYYNNSSVQISFDEPKSIKVYMQTIDLLGCLNQKQFDVQILEGPSSDNVTGKLNSLNNLKCLEIGSSIELNSEITSLEPPLLIKWLSTGEIKFPELSFDLIVDENTPSNIDIQVIFEGCNVDLSLDLDHSINYETSFSNSYQGEELCHGETIYLENTTPNAIGNPDFSWDIEGAQIIHETPDWIYFSYNKEGIFNWKLSHNGGCPSEDIKTSTIKLADGSEYPTAVIKSGNLSTCTIPFDLSVDQEPDSSEGNGDNTYYWSLESENVIIANSRSEIFEYKIQNPGIYDLILEVEKNGLKCTTKDSISIAADDLNLDLNLTKTSECAGYEFKPMGFAVNQLNESVTYDWQLITNEMITHNSDLQSPSFLLEEPGEYDLLLNLYSNINSNCEKTIYENELITINKNPDLDLSTENINDCPSFPANFNIEVESTLEETYSWFLSDDLDTLEWQNNKAFTYKFDDPGAYRLNWIKENQSTNCTTEQEIEINLDEVLLELDNSQPIVAHCMPFRFKPNEINQSKRFHGKFSYTWELIDSSGEIYQTLNDLEGTFEIDEVDLYDIQLSVSNEDGSCFNQVKLDAFIDVRSYELNMGVLESNSCFTDENREVEKILYVDFDIPQNLNTYHNWEVTPDAQIVSTTNDTLKLLFKKAGTYVVKHSAYINNSECIYSKTITLEVGANFEIATSRICLGKSFIVEENKDAAVATNTSYTWSTPDEEMQISNPTINRPTISANKPGAYLLELTVQNDLGCAGSTSKYIEAYEVDALFSSPQVGDQCNPAIINLNSSNNRYINSYTWNIHKNGSLGFESDDTFKTIAPNFETLFNGVGNYDVELIIESLDGCSDSITERELINIISPKPFFTMKQEMKCDTLHVTLIDESEFIDNFYIDFGNNAQNAYVLNEENQISYTYPEGGVESIIEYDISLTARYKFCNSVFKSTVQVEKPINPDPPNINFVTVNSNGNVFIEWSKQNIDLDDSNMVKIYHHESGTTKSLVGSSNQISKNYFFHTTSTDSVNFYSTTLTDKICNKTSIHSSTHATMFLETTTSSYETIDLNWTEYLGWAQVSSYSIYRSVDGGPYEFIDEVPGNQRNYTDTYLCNVIYGYYIIANHPTENFKSKSNTSWIEPLYVNFNEPLEIIKSTITMDSNIFTDWKPHSNHNSASSAYVIDRWDKYFGWITNYAVCNEAPFIDEGTSIYNRYRYRVKYTDQCGNIGPVSNYGSNILLHGKQYPSHFELYWNSYEEWDTGVKQYTIQYHNTKENIYRDIATVIDTSFVDRQFKKDGVDDEYCFRIIATKSQDVSIRSTSNSICFVPKPKDYFPNAFSPNMDGVNETFKYEGRGAKALTTKIYSRWGILVYESVDVNFEWDGKNLKTGESCTVGTYIFNYELTGFDGTVIKNNKIISLIR